MKKVWHLTEEEKKDLIEIYHANPSSSFKEIGTIFLEKYGYNYSRKTITCFLRSQGFINKSFYQEEEISFIKKTIADNPKMNNIQIHSLFCEKFGNIRSFLGINLIITRLKLREIPLHRHRLPIGSEVSYLIDGKYIVHIKTQNGKLVHKDKYIWEKAYGPVSKEQILVHKDNDQNNCELNNLMLVSSKITKFCSKEKMTWHNEEELKTIVALVELRSAIRKQKRRPNKSRSTITYPLAKKEERQILELYYANPSVNFSTICKLFNENYCSNGHHRNRKEIVSFLKKQGFINPYFYQDEELRFIKLTMLENPKMPVKQIYNLFCEKYGNRYSYINFCNTIYRKHLRKT
jgi:hypothetical protein